jgi:hypothetical protein
MSRHSVLIVSLYLFAGVVERAGEFQPHVDYRVGAGPQSVAIGDFNADGKPDLAAADYLDNTVSVLLGNGDGTFQAHLDYGVGSAPGSVGGRDFNGDGKPDLATA